MRILFISRRFFPAISGMSVYALNLLRELAALGHDVTMISQYRGDEVGTRVYGGGPPPPVPEVKVIGLESLGEQAGGDFERDIRDLVAAAEAEHRRRPFELVHAQYGYPTGLAALEFSKRAGVPNVVSIQGGDGHWVGSCCETHRRAMAIVLNHAGALLIGSKSFSEEVQGNHGTPLDRFTIVPGAVNTTRFHPRPDYQAGALQAPDAPVLLYHGRVDRRKGALDLLDAFAHRRAGWRGRLSVAVSGPDPPAGGVGAPMLAAPAAVEITGYVGYGETPAVYHRGDVFVSPTYAEGFSNTILEAMASGLPIVSTQSVGVIDCLAHDRDALLVRPGDVEALREALEVMVSHEVLRKRLAEKALSEVDALYSWPVVARQIDGIYQKLAGTKPDTDWDGELPVEPCRFRQTPHLL